MFGLFKKKKKYENVVVEQKKPMSLSPSPIQRRSSIPSKIDMGATQAYTVAPRIDNDFSTPINFNLAIPYLYENETRRESLPEQSSGGHSSSWGSDHSSSYGCSDSSSSSYDSGSSDSGGCSDGGGGGD